MEIYISLQQTLKYNNQSAGRKDQLITVMALQNKQKMLLLFQTLMAGGQSPPPLPTSALTITAEVKIKINTRPEKGFRVPKIEGYPPPPR